MTPRVSDHRRLLWLMLGAPALLAASCGDGPTSLADARFSAGPRIVKIVAGDGQTGTVAQPLAEDLIVEVTDDEGRPIEGIEVVWIAGGGGLATPKTKGKTDRFGRAAGSWQLGTSAGEQQLDAVVGEVDTLSFGATAVADVPTILNIVAGNGQTAQAGHALPDTIVARSADRFDNPTPGVSVAWSVSDGGQIVADATTDDTGLARVLWSLGENRGERSITGSIGTGGPSAQATATGTGPPVSLEIVAGNAQTGLPGQPLPESLVVVVRDDAGVQIGGVPVTWEVVSGGGAVSPDRPTTDGTGSAAAEWQLGPQIGNQRASASVAGLTPVEFTATAGSGTLAAVVKVSGDQQNGVVGAPLPDSLVIRVEDALGNPVPGAIVDWQTADGGDLSPASSVTDGAGEVQAAWTLGPTAGTRTATVVVGGLAATFDAIGAADIPATLVKLVGDLQSGIVGALLGDSLVVRVRDQFGNPVPGAAVDWQTADGTLSAAVSVTDATGEARIAWTLGTLAGAQTATASIGGLTAGFDATGLADVPAALVKVAGDAQSGLIGLLLADPLVVRVEDQFGNPVPGVTVDWSVLLGLGSADPSTSITDAAGQASTTWTLGLLLGLQTMESRVGSSLMALFTATAL